ncbi:cold-shock protein [Bradyrhizobium sp.]|uniref:cold-shock protein n=1 Tax=Bradyrhizobium sp. TaxID=376 RepID=UPI00261D1D49|nr:cold shock domain-containing protein [Bradyrhizobium sp.]
MMRGTVKFFDLMRGYGFIKTDGGDDVFVHRSDLQPSCRVGGELMLAPDQRVSFEVVEAARGPRATTVAPA